MSRRGFPPRMQSCGVAEHDEDESSTQVLELAVYWHGELLSVRHVALAPDQPPDLADLGAPEAPGVEVRATPVFAARRIGRQPVDVRPLASTLFAALVHALVLGAIGWHALGSQTAGVTGEDLDLMRSYLASSERAHALVDGSSAGHGDEAQGTPGGTGVRAAGDEGAMGLSSSRGSNAHYAVASRESEGDEPVSVEEASTFGMISLLARYDHAEATEWASPQQEGNGGIWGTAVGDAFGIGGIGLTGVGQGGGGNGAGIGLGTIGTCDDTCTGSRGMGSGHGRLTLEGRRSATIVCRLSAATVTGRLPPEAIQRVVHQSFGRFRYCYEQGLARDASLAGRVTTKFVIARDGSVSTAVDGGSDLPDANVTACVQRTFTGLSFPEPPGGVVTVVYPISFSPE